MTKSRNVLRIIAIALVIIFIAAAILLVIQLWDKKRGQFQPNETAGDTVEYEGKKYEKNEKVESMLLLGLDKFSEVPDEPQTGGVRTDFLMLFVFDNEKKQCSAVQISRDTMTKVNRLAIGGTSVVDSYTEQIALAYNYVQDDNDKIRCRNTKDSVEYLLKGVRINHYFSVTMDSVPVINDLLGGIEVTVLDDFTGVDDTLVKGETVTLTGDHALTYVRSRYGLEDSSNKERMVRQKQYVNALYQKAVARMQSDSNFALTLADTLDKCVVFDSSNQKMRTFIDKFNDYEFLGIREIDGELKLGEEYMEFYPDEASVWKTVIELFYKEAK